MKLSLCLAVASIVVRHVGSQLVGILALLILLAILIVEMAAWFQDLAERD
jgi:hypothetical protein